MKLLILFIALTSTSVFADTFDFECTGTDLVYVNSFSMEGSIDTEDGEISYTVETREAGNNGVVTLRESVTRQASFEQLREDMTGNFSAYRAFSLDKEDDHVYVNLLIDYAGKLSSQIRDASGRAFRSDCKSL